MEDLLFLAREMQLNYIYQILFNYEELQEYMLDVYSDEESGYNDGVALIDKSIIGDDVNYLLTTKPLPFKLIAKL